LQRLSPAGASGPARSSCTEGAAGTAAAEAAGSSRLQVRLAQQVGRSDQHAINR